MRGSAVLGFLLLAGCQYAGNPFAGFGGFIGDTHTFNSNPNRAVGNSVNARRVMGKDVAVQPLLPEPGDVWPAPAPPEPTLSDIEREQREEYPPPGQQPPAVHPQPRPTPPGSSTPPMSNQPAPALPSGTPAVQLPETPKIHVPPPTVETPRGPVVPNPGNGMRTFNAPGGGQGIIIPNGNGTSTVIGPDGSVTTIQTPGQ